MRRFKKLLPIAVTLALVAVLAMPMAALADVSSATVTADPAIISTADADYTITFAVGAAGALAAADTITIVFPDDTAVADDTGAQGNIVGTVEDAEGAEAIVTVTGDSTTRTVVITIPANIIVLDDGTAIVVLTAGITNPTVAGLYTLTVATSVEASAITSGSYSITETGTTAVTGNLPNVIEVAAPTGFTMPSLDPSASPISSAAKVVDVDANGTSTWTLQAHGSDSGKMKEGGANTLDSAMVLNASGAGEGDVGLSGTAQAIDTHAAGSADISVTFKQTVIYTDTVASDYSITVTFTVGFDV